MPTDELLEAVDALTKPVTVTLWVDGNLHRRTDPPLLTQLHSAITSSLGTGGGAGRAARERTPLDVGAFNLYEQIDGRVRSWLDDVGVRPSSKADPATILRRWYVLWKQRQVEESSINRHTQILLRWGTAITDLLSPPDRVELTQRCPRCQAMWTTIGTGEEAESIRALWAVWREDPNESYGECKSCEHFWRGVGNMRLLRIELDEASKVSSNESQPA